MNVDFNPTITLPSSSISSVLQIKGNERKGFMSHNSKIIQKQAKKTVICSIKLFNIRDKSFIF